MDSQLDIYLKELLAWNEAVNITAITDPEQIKLKHFEDSLTVLEALPSTAKKIIDIGTGAGFPGLMLKIAQPELEITLVDSVQKKVAFLDHMIEVLSLKGVTALAARAETLAHDPAYREQYDVAVGRAVAALPIFAEYTLPFVKVGGIVIAQKQLPSEPIDESAQALAELGGKFIKTIPITKPGLTDRQLIIIEKSASTPERYPRRPGVPTKRPL